MILLLLLFLNNHNETYKPIFNLETKNNVPVEIIQIHNESIPETIDRVCKEKGFTRCNLLKRIAFCESSFNPKAKNPKSSARGLFQILNMHGLSKGEREDPEIATQWAITHFNNGKPWNSSRSCWE